MTYQSTIEEVDGLYHYEIFDPDCPFSLLTGETTDRESIANNIKLINQRQGVRRKSLHRKDTDVYLKNENRVHGQIDKTPQTITQIAKILNMKRWTVNKAVNHLMDRGQISPVKLYGGKKGYVK